MLPHVLLLRVKFVPLKSGDIPKHDVVRSPWSLNKMYLSDLIHAGFMGHLNSFTSSLSFSLILIKPVRFSNYIMKRIGSFRMTEFVSDRQTENGL